MSILTEVTDYLDELTAVRRDIHAHPELAFAEERTADLVAAKKLVDAKGKLQEMLTLIDQIQTGGSIRILPSLIDHLDRIEIERKV